MITVTCVAPVNIAVIKYWGKRDEELILPINDSISATLSTSQMCATTTISASPNFKKNKFWLNDREESFENNNRLSNCLKELKARVKENQSDLINWNIHICSRNNFPTAAGLASSAAGYACLVYTLAQLYGVNGDISAIARRGSGSASRSLFGGWVQWHKGELNDGSDSIATQIAPASHWPQMRVLILVVNDSKKKHSSTSGMKLSVETSDLLKYRAANIVPQRTNQMRDAILARNFQTFATLTMKDSNQFHAICLDTFPPCVYMNAVSHSIVEMVHEYNKLKGAIKVAYTFDAGPNACLYLLENDVPEVVALVNHVFPSNSNPIEYFKGIAVDSNKRSDFSTFAQCGSDLLKYIIYTRVGEGPQRLHGVHDHLLNEQGLPK